MLEIQKRDAILDSCKVRNIRRRSTSFRRLPRSCVLVRHRRSSCLSICFSRSVQWRYCHQATSKSLGPANAAAQRLAEQLRIPHYQHSIKYRCIDCDLAVTMLVALDASMGNSDDSIPIAVCCNFEAMLLAAARLSHGLGWCRPLCRWAFFPDSA